MKTGRKISGGKYRASRKKKLFERKGQPRVVKLAERKSKPLRIRGGSIKRILHSENHANLMVKGKAKKVKITNVLETQANSFLARQNILVKGAIVETELGKARITNRPGQEGMVQAVLLD